MSDLPASPVGLLQDVAIRTAFPGEASHFTPWMASDEVVSYLGRRIGLGDLTIAGVEVPIPGGRALDILATTPDGRQVAIENQFGQADHDHFTRGLAYAVGLHAKALVIVAEGHRGEFVAVAQYLNSVAEQAEDDGIAVFLVRARVVGIGDALAVDFDVVVGPNEWKAAVAKTAPASVDPALPAFWERFETALTANPPTTHPMPPVNRTDNINGIRTTDHPAVRFYVSAAKKHSYAFVAIDTATVDRTNELFDRLHERQAEIHQRCQLNLLWERRDEKTSARLTSPKLPFGYGTAYSDADLQNLAVTFRNIVDGLSPMLAELALE
jgi:hypothetical protein